MSPRPPLWLVYESLGIGSPAAVIPAPAGDAAIVPRESPAVASRRSLRLSAVAGRLALRVGLTAATLLLAALALLPLFHHRALIVTSGSMEPLLSAGDAAIIDQVPAEQLRANDVITYQGYGTERLTTHRIVKPVHLESGLHFQTQGDANAAPDPHLAPAEGVVGRYVGGIPDVGRFLLVLEQPNARLIIVGVPAMLTLIAELRYLLGGRIKLRLGRRSAGALAAAILVVGGAAVGAVTTTAALITDADTVADNSFATAATFP